MPDREQCQCRKCKSKNIELLYKPHRYLIRCGDCLTKYAIPKNSIDIDEWRGYGVVKDSMEIQQKLNIFKYS